MIREFFRKLQLFLLLALGTYPVFALICVFFAPQMVGYIWPFSAAFVAAGCLLLLLPKKARFVAFFLGCIAFLLPACFAVPDARAIMLFCGLCHCGLLLWHLQIRSWGGGQEISGGWMALWLGALITGYVLSYQVQLLAPAAPILRVGLFVYVFLGLCSLNRSSLYLASGGKNCITDRMRRTNLLLVVGMFVLAVVAALFSSASGIFAAIYAFIQSLRGRGEMNLEETTEFIETVMTTVATEATAAVGSGGGAVGTTEALEELPPVINPPNWIIAFYVLCVAAGALFVLVAIFAKWVNKPDKKKKAVRPDIADEITSIRKSDKEGQHIKKEKAEQIPGWLSPAKRIRRRYKALLDKNPHWRKSSTARENLREDAAQIYEKTRYSSHTITKQDAEDFKNKTK